MPRQGRRVLFILLLLALGSTIIVLSSDRSTGSNSPYFPSSGFFSSPFSHSLKFGTTPNTHGLYVIPRSTLPQLKEHPITTLLREGEAKAAAVDRKIESIRTISDAVADYRDAFSMDPPLGFDLWYAFCSKHSSIPVPSLLSQAHLSVLPYLAYPASLLRERIKALEEKSATWWFEVVYGEEAEGLEGGLEGLKVMGEDGEWRGLRRGGDANKGPRPRDMAGLYEGFLPYIPHPPPTSPPLRLAFGMHDGPAYVTTSDIYLTSLTLARSGQLWDLTTLSEMEKDAMSRENDRKGWKWTCERRSPLWRENGGMGVGGGGKVPVGEVGEGEGEGPAVVESLDGIGGAEVQVQEGSRSFIGDMPKTQDFCQNPALMDLHGTLLNDVSRRTAPMVPQIATSKTWGNSDVLSTPLEATGQTQDYVEWSSKTENRLFWRGKLTGAFHNHWTRWRQSQRERASFLVNREDGQIEVLVDAPRGMKGPEMRSFGAKELNARYMDVAAVDGAVQCDPGECEKVEEAMTFGSRVPIAAQVKYKYILDMDGNAWSSRFRRLLTGMSVTLKSTIFPEWNSDMLIPWYHYIPVQIDYSDIYDIMAYFAGQPDRPDTGHDAEAEKIAVRARKFAEDRWAWEDMQSYMLLMTLEYQRAVSDDREAASYRV